MAVAVYPSFTADRLQRVWRGLGLSAPAHDLHADLVAAWSEPHRAYHTLQHLEECLAQLDAVRPDGFEVEVALWFHDAIYDTHAYDNEEKSVEWARRELAACGASTGCTAHIHELIMATRHNAIPTGEDARLMVDIDLAILGSNEARFAEYEAQVAREYAWVPLLIYRRERTKILQNFLDRDRIYATELFHNRLDANARRNLAWSISLNRER